ncbi:MAG: branched-chain amino acid transport system substrate-binding protein [Bacillota bacterium]|nr:branched-chain amino acid transport system substrate-binding protein [Bacillota bacterium]
MRRLIQAVLGVTLLILLTSLTAFAQTAEPIKIGVYEPMTGAMAAGGQMTWEGIALAHEMQPTVLGRPVKLILVDNKSDKVESANAVARLVEQEKVVAIIGSYGSSNSIAGGDVAEKAGIPMVTDSATNPLVTQGKKFVFRACFIDPFQGEVMAKYVFHNLKLKKVAILKDVAQDYSVGLANYFKKTFTKLTGDPKSVVAEVAYQTGDQDFTAQLTQVISSKAEALFVPGYFGDAALIAKQLRQLGSKIPILGGDALDAPELMSIGGKAVEGVTISSFYSAEAPANEVAKKFVAAYKSKYGKTPNANAALGFDTYNMVLDAIRRAGSTDPKAIRDALATTKGFIAVTGSITIDENGDATKDAVILRVENGVFRYVTTIHP